MGVSRRRRWISSAWPYRVAPTRKATSTTSSRSFSPSPRKRPRYAATASSTSRRSSVISPRASSHLRLLRDEPLEHAQLTIDLLRIAALRPKHEQPFQCRDDERSEVVRLRGARDGAFFGRLT